MTKIRGDLAVKARNIEELRAEEPDFDALLREALSGNWIRLRAHLSQFAAVLDDAESNGRKLEFIVQEMGRETNTIGSKSNDVEVSRCVFDMKGALEKIRELIANVE